ncbi:MAG TPA: inositol phosphatase [Anaerolineae bacterium]|nr:inositol phosphatase [Anaerolineae bacterium]HID85725.1 inositol phosphatase [Anaerolineales bacterium]HIQ09484.1 inositol phosphatase [Anaerolineaceae bacterium]
MTLPHPTPEKALAVARPLTEEVGRVLLARFVAGERTARQKADTTLVTEADREADRRLVEGLRAAFPGLPVLSEEGATRWPAAAPAGWVVDPLDGTTNFAVGWPIWGVSVAYVVEGWPVAGVLHYPTLGLTVTATRGGAWMGKRRITVQRTTQPGGGALVALCSRTARRVRVLPPWKARISGCATYDFLSVAAGQTVAALHASPKVWDLAAVWLIVREAGGLWRPWGEARAGEPFPLHPGEDYASRAFPLLAAASEEALARLGRQLAPWAGEALV